MCISPRALSLMGARTLLSKLFPRQKGLFRPFILLDGPRPVRQIGFLRRRARALGLVGRLVIIAVLRGGRSISRSRRAHRQIPHLTEAIFGEG